MKFGAVVLRALLLATPGASVHLTKTPIGADHQPRPAVELPIERPMPGVYSSSSGSTIIVSEDRWQTLLQDPAGIRNLPLTSFDEARDDGVTFEFVGNVVHVKKHGVVQAHWSPTPENARGDGGVTVFAPHLTDHSPAECTDECSTKLDCLLEICADASLTAMCKDASEAAAQAHQKISAVQDVIFGEVAAAVHAVWKAPMTSVTHKRIDDSASAQRFLKTPVVSAVRAHEALKAVVDDVVFGEGVWIKQFDAAEKGDKDHPESMQVDAAEFRYREYLGQRECYRSLSLANGKKANQAAVKVIKIFDKGSIVRVGSKKREAYLEVGIDVGRHTPNDVAWSLISVSCERVAWPEPYENSLALTRNVEQWRNKDHFGEWMEQNHLDEFVPRNFTPELPDNDGCDGDCNAWRSSDIVGAVNVDGFDGHLVIKPQLGGGSALVKICKSSQVDCWKSAIKSIQDDATTNQDGTLRNWGGVTIQEAIPGNTAFGTFYVAHEGELLDAFTMEYYYGKKTGPFPTLPPGGNLRKAGGSPFWAKEANEDIKNLLRKILKTEVGMTWSGIGDVEWKYYPRGSDSNVVPVIFDWNPRIGGGPTMSMMEPYFVRKLIDAHEATAKSFDKGGADESGTM